MKIHDLKPADGSNRRKRRVGRGIAGKGGKTAGRGTKGQGARDTIPLNFEGGQLPLTQRVPKLRGFNNPFRVSYTAINLDDVAALDVDVVDFEVLRNNGLVGKKDLVKILGRGEVGKAITVKAHAFSKSAEEAIKAAGGSIELLEKPHGDRRIPARGNQHTNR